MLGLNILRNQWNGWGTFCLEHVMATDLLTEELPLPISYMLHALCIKSLFTRHGKKIVSRTQRNFRFTIHVARAPH